MKSIETKTTRMLNGKKNYCVQRMENKANAEAEAEAVQRSKAER